MESISETIMSISAFPLGGITSFPSSLTVTITSCRSPISSLADINKNGVLKLQGYVVNLKGTKMVKGSLSDNFKNAINIGEKLAKKLIKKGAKDILAL